MAGKERDLKIAADSLCSWRSFPEQRKTWNRANIALPHSYPKERVWVRAAWNALCLCLVGNGQRDPLEEVGGFKGASTIIDQL